jgi:hypothetical protein
MKKNTLGQLQKNTFESILLPCFQKKLLTSYTPCDKCLPRDICRPGFKGNVREALKKLETWAIENTFEGFLKTINVQL